MLAGVAIATPATAATGFAYESGIPFNEGLMKNHIFPKLSENGKKVFIHEGKDYQKFYDEILKNNEDEVEIDSNLKDRCFAFFIWL